VGTGVHAAREVELELIESGVGKLGTDAIGRARVVVEGEPLGITDILTADSEIHVSAEDLSVIHANPCLIGHSERLVDGKRVVVLPQHDANTGLGVDALVELQPDVVAVGKLDSVHEPGRVRARGNGHEVGGEHASDDVRLLLEGLHAGLESRKVIGQVAEAAIDLGQLGLEPVAQLSDLLVQRGLVDQAALSDRVIHETGKTVGINGASRASGTSRTTGARIAALTLGASGTSRASGTGRASGTSRTGNAILTGGARALDAHIGIDVPQQASQRHRELVTGQEVLALEGPVGVTLE